MEPIKVKTVQKVGDREVCKGKLVFIKCKSEDLEPKQWLLRMGNRIIIPAAGGEYRRMQQNGFAPIKPIIISETESIHSGEKYICDSIMGWDIKECEDFDYGDFHPSKKLGCFKILVMPERVSPDTFKLFVEGKLKDGDNVIVDCEFGITGGTILNHNDGFSSSVKSEAYYRIKITKCYAKISSDVKKDYDWEKMARILYGLIQVQFGKGFDQWVEEDYFVKYLAINEEYIKGLRDKVKKRTFMI